MQERDEEEKPTFYVKRATLETTTQDNGWKPVEDDEWNDSGAKESNGWGESNNNILGQSNGDTGFQGSGRGGRGGESNGKCFNCNQEGYMSQECTEPRAERGGGRGGGRGGSRACFNVTGENLPSGIDSFDAAGLRPKILANIKKSGYTQPTPFQKWAIPVIMKKRDLMACAQTGSGKTGAYLIPILYRLIEEGCAVSSYDETQIPEAVVMCPTRELAIQIFKEAVKFSYDTLLNQLLSMMVLPLVINLTKLRKCEEGEMRRWLNQEKQKKKKFYLRKEKFNQKKLQTFWCIRLLQCLRSEYSTIRICHAYGSPVTRSTLTPSRLCLLCEVLLLYKVPK